MSKKSIEGIKTYSGDETGVKQDIQLDVEETCEETETAHTPNQGKCSRRSMIAGAAAAVFAGAAGVVAVPLVGNAKSTDPATKNEVAALEYELAMIMQTSSDAELTSHKTTTIDKNSTDLQYPSAKAVYDALGDKIDIYQGEQYAGYIFVVGKDGTLQLQKFTTDELSEDSTLPVENKAIYKQIKAIKKALENLDPVPAKDSEYGVQSGGVYKTYQQTAEITDFSTVEMGVNYKYTGTAITGVDGVFSIKKIDSVLTAVSQSDPSMVFTSIDNGAKWAAPYGGW